MKRVITFFAYTYTDRLGNAQEGAGSYFGRKPATVDTLRRFSRNNEAKSGARWMRCRNFRIVRTSS